MDRKACGLALIAALALGAAAPAWSEPEKPGATPAATQATVLDVLARSKDARDVRLDEGAEHGVKERQVFEIFRETKAYALPLAGDAKLRVNRELVARAVVYAVQPRTALARLFDEKGKVEAKQLAYLSAQAQAPALEPYVRGATPIEKSPQAQAPWRGKVSISLDVEVAPGRRVYYEWRSPGGGTFTRGNEVSPGVFRTVTPQNDWVAPLAAKSYPINVTITDSVAPKPVLYSLKLESTGPKQERAANPHVLRTLFQKTKLEGARDVAFDSRNNLWVLDGTPGFTSHEYLRGTNADGVSLGQAEVARGNFAALAVNEDYFFFLDVKDGCVKRFAKGGALNQVLSSEPLRIGESGSGNGRFKDPVDLALLADGSVLVLDAGQRCVHRFDPDGRFVYSFGHPGEGDHDLKEPVALAVSQDGTVFVLDNGRKRVVVFKDGRTVREDVEVGVPSEELRGLAVDDFGGNIAILERGSGAAKLFTQTRDGWANTWKSGSMGSEDVAALRKPVRMRIDATRVLYVIDRDGDSIARFDASERLDFCGRWGDVELSDSVRLAATAEGDVVALDRSKARAFRFDRMGWATAKMGLESQQQGQLKQPVGVGVDQDGAIFVVDASKHELEKYQPRGGGWLRAYGSETVLPKKLVHGQMSSQREKFIAVMDTDQSLAVIDPVQGDLVPITPGDREDVVCATFCGRFDAGAKSDEGYFWIVDKSGERVGKFPLGSSQQPADVTATFKKVTGIAANGAGAVFLCDRKASTIEVYAGNGVKLNSISDETALGSPLDVATDDLGHLFVFDEDTKRIVELGE